MEIPHADEHNNDVGPRSIRAAVTIKDHTLRIGTAEVRSVSPNDKGKYQGGEGAVLYLRKPARGLKNLVVVLLLWRASALCLQRRF